MRSGAFHGGAFFEAIGVDLRQLERSAGVISADVLDAWFDPSPRVLDFLQANLPFLLRTSPPNHAEGLVAEVALWRGVPESSILAGGGSSALLFGCLPRIIAPGAGVLLLDPMYSEYEHIAGTLLGAQIHRHSLREDDGFELNLHHLADDIRRLRPDAVLLVNPSNPTGGLWDRQAMLDLIDSTPPPTRFVVDETYIDYAGPAESLETEAALRRNLIVIKSMSKVYALSGARVAYLVASPEVADGLRPWLPPWPVGLLAQAAAMEALRDPDYYTARHSETRLLREDFRARLAPLNPMPSQANFFLIRPPNAAELACRLREDGIYVREFGDGPLAGRWLRVTVKDAALSARISEAML
ncbi:MAG: histidinol-phosphate aminotransferase family protein [Bryobacteraceae bacterium]|nr:histidinol-phosphate aminotransferase family protein [Bryobacteraceae bacterium]